MDHEEMSLRQLTYTAPFHRQVHPPSAVRMYHVEHPDGKLSTQNSDVLEMEGMLDRVESVGGVNDIRNMDNGSGCLQGQTNDAFLS